MLGSSEKSCQFNVGVEARELQVGSQRHIPESVGSTLHSIFPEPIPPAVFITALMPMCRNPYLQDAKG